jgi:hypothetical protein
MGGEFNSLRVVSFQSVTGGVSRIDPFLEFVILTNESRISALLLSIQLMMIVE